MTSDSTKLHRIRFWDCWDGKVREKYEKTLIDCGAKIQDFRHHFKSDEVEFVFTLHFPFSEFVERLRKTDKWLLTGYSDIYTGSLEP